MAPEHALALDVERRCPEPLRHAVHVRRVHEQEHGPRIDEAADEPGAGDAVDLRARARHPHRAPARVAGRQDGDGHHGQPGRRPSEGAAFERFGRNAKVPQPRGHPLAELQPFLADHHGGPARAGELGRPAIDIPEGAAQRARNQARIAGEVLVRANVEEGRRVGPPDEAGKLVGRDGVERGHACASLSRIRTRCLGMSPRGEIAIPMTRIVGRTPRDAQWRRAAPFKPSA
jgi:hypothetical protein